jgi:hypothetical protein
MDIQTLTIWRNWYEVLSKDLLTVLGMNTNTARSTIVTIADIKALFSSMSSVSNKTFAVRVRQKTTDNFSLALQVHNVNDQSVLVYDARQIKYYRIAYNDIDAFKLNKKYKRFEGNKVYSVQH